MKTYSRLIDGIYKGDESPCKISALVVHAWYIRNDESFVFLCELEVVRRTSRFPNDFVETEPGTFPTRLWHHDVASPYLMRGFVWRVVIEVTQESEPALCVCL